MSGPHDNNRCPSCGSTDERHASDCRFGKAGWSEFKKAVATALKHEGQLDAIERGAIKKYGRAWPFTFRAKHQKAVKKMRENDELILQLAKELVRNGVE